MRGFLHAKNADAYANTCTTYANCPSEDALHRKRECFLSKKETIQTTIAKVSYHHFIRKIFHILHEPQNIHVLRPVL